MENRKFRGISLSTGRFVYGGYLKFLPYTPAPIRKDENDVPPGSDYKHLIFTEGFSDWNLPRDISVYDIKPETLGQCTGIKVDYQYLYEGDLVSVERTYGILTGEVKFGEHEGKIGFYIDWDSEVTSDVLYWLDKDLKIIGNIHQTI